MNSTFTHAHFGAGKLGLGFVIPITKKAGYKTILITRTGNPEREPTYSKLRKDRKYVLKIKKMKGKKLVSTNKIMSLPVFLEYKNKIEKEVIDKKLATNDLRLITTAVGESNLGRVSEIIASIIKVRHIKKIKKNLIIMACENLTKNSHELKKRIEHNLNDNQKSHLENYVYFCNCVVDRICPSIDHKEKFVTTTAYDYYDWIISKEGLHSEDVLYLSKKFKNLKIQLVNEKEFQIREKLKIWGFNGIHMALAVYGGRIFPDNELLSEVVKNHGINQHVRRLQQMYAYVISSNFGVDQKKLLKYQDMYVKRIEENNDDKIERIILDLLKLIKSEKSKFREVDAFLKKIHDRLIEPINVFLEIRSRRISASKAKKVNEYLIDCVGLLASVIELIRKKIFDEKFRKATEKIN